MVSFLKLKNTLISSQHVWQQSFFRLNTAARFITMNDYGKAKFKQFAKDNRLRLRRGEDGLPIVVPTNKFKGFHLFEGFGNDFVGLFASKDTQRKFSFAHNKLVKMGCIPNIIGDTEGSYKISYDDLLPIAVKLNMIMKDSTGIDPVWLKKN